MYIKKIETIYLTQEEDKLLCQVYSLLEEIEKKTENKEIEEIIRNIMCYLYDLNEYVEEE
jgi:hypothetical protein